MARRLSTIGSHLLERSPVANADPNLPKDATEITPDVLYECVPSALLPSGMPAAWPLWLVAG
jgi:hypothetical protein